MRTTVASATFFLLLCAVERTHASAGGSRQHERCDPLVFPDAAVNVVVVPYTDATGRTTATTRRLSALLHTEMLLSLAIYGDAAVVLSSSESRGTGPCDVATVYDKLLTTTEAPLQMVRAPGPAFVMVWGQIYEEAGDISAQTYLRFHRSGVDAERLDVGVGELGFTGRLASQRLAFAPASLTLEDLARAERAAGTLAVSYDAPTPSAHQSPIGLAGKSADVAFRVTEVRNAWARLVQPGPGAASWIRVRSSADERLLPALKELDFLEGVVGYLQYRQRHAVNQVFDAPDSMAHIEAAFNRFEAAAAEPDDTWPRAVARQMLATLRFMRPAPAAAELTLAHDRLKEAAELLPHSAESQNLEVIARVYLAYRAGRRGLRQKGTVEDLRRAAALAPADEAVPLNLLNLYELFRREAPSASAEDLLARSEIDEGLRTVRNVVSYLARARDQADIAFHHIELLPVTGSTVWLLAHELSASSATITGLSGHKVSLLLDSVADSAQRTDYSLSEQFVVVAVPTTSQTRATASGVPGLGPAAPMNKTHGAVSYAFMHDRLQSKNIDERLQASLQRGIQPDVVQDNSILVSHDWQGNLGGALVRDRAWFSGFGSWTRFDALQLGAINPDGTQGIDDSRTGGVGGRLTVQLSRKTSMTASYDQNQRHRLHFRRAPYLFAEDSASWLRKEVLHSLSGRVTHMLSAGSVLRVRADQSWGTLPYEYQSEVSPDAVAQVDVVRFTRSLAAPHRLRQEGDRLQLSASIDVVTGAHTWKGGVHASHEWTDFDVDRIRDVLLEFRDGTALQASLSNTPLRARQRAYAWSAFAQNIWKPTHRWTIDLGARLDGIDANAPDAKRGNIPSWLNVGFHAAASMFLTEQTTLTGGYQRFVKPVGSELTAALNPNGFAESVVSWLDRNEDRRLDPGELGPFTGVVGGITTRLDPNAHRPYGERFHVSVRRALGDVAFSVRVDRTHHRDGLGVLDLARPPASYFPTSWNYPDPETAQRRSIEVFNLDPALVAARNRLVTNLSELRSDESALQLVASKRYSRGWHLQASLTLQKHKGFLNDGTFTNVDLNDPNVRVNRAGASIFAEAPWVFALSGGAALPYGVEASARYVARAGSPLQKTVIVDGLTQVSEEVHVSPRGTDRTETVNRLLDARLTRKLNRGNRTEMELAIDVFNVFNANHVLMQVDRVGSFWGRPMSLAAPRSAKLGINLRF